MKKKYFLGSVLVIVLASCGVDYEWISVNADKINKAKKGIPTVDTLRTVNLSLNLQEKENIIYFNNADSFLRPKTKVESKKIKKKK